MKKKRIRSGIEVISDSEINSMTEAETRAELFRIRQEILDHRMHRDDRRMYVAVLPEADKGMGLVRKPLEAVLAKQLRYFRTFPDILKRHVKRGDFDRFITGGLAKTEIKRVRRLVRTHKRRTEDRRRWLNDEVLYQATIPEGSCVLGRTLSVEEIQFICRFHIEQQKKFLPEPSKSRR